MLLPREGELYSIYLDDRHGMFVHAQDFPDALFVLQTRWSSLRNVLPPDSSCLVVVYENKARKLVLGVYDVLRLRSVDKAGLSVFERQGLLNSQFQALTDPLDSVQLHWVGTEESLFGYMQQPTNLPHIPFQVDHMLRLQPGTATQDPTQYELILRPVLTGNFLRTTQC